MKVEWDEEKNLRNLDKHGIRFKEAREIFLSDSDYIEIFDADHSDDEDRLQLGRYETALLSSCGLNVRMRRSESSVHDGLPAKRRVRSNHAWMRSRE